MTRTKPVKNWGAVNEHGVELWDAEPVFRDDHVGLLDWIKLLFYPKKWFLYRYIRKHFIKISIPPLVGEGVGGVMSKLVTPSSLPLPGGGFGREPFRVLDVGCGTGAAVIDLKKLFGRSAEVVGIEVVKLQVELAQTKMRKYGVWAKIEWYDGEHIPFPAEYFDAVYTSDVLGHVPNVPAWLGELERVMKPGGALAMFSESRLGWHAYIRNYLFQRGLNVDPHAAFHISLYSKKKLQALLEKAGFDIKKMRGVFWASFFVHPDEFYPALSKTRQFPFLRTVNALLHYTKKITHPFSTALCELYGLVEMSLAGKWIEAQGYIILARKR